jgi:hypothetical protein
MRWATVAPAFVLASAQTSAVHIEYVAPSGCPNQGVFRDRLDARIREAPAEPTGRSLRALGVRVDSRDG